MVWGSLLEHLAQVRVRFSRLLAINLLPVGS